jgi:hypothetical protein
VFVAIDAAVKFSVVLRNDKGARQLSATGGAEWVPAI